MTYLQSQESFFKFRSIADSTSATLSTVVMIIRIFLLPVSSPSMAYEGQAVLWILLSSKFTSPFLSIWLTSSLLIFRQLIMQLACSE